jgi:hypothetical protein
MGRPLLGDRPTTGAERKRKWRERQREKQKLDPAFDPSADGMSVLMARALPILTPGLERLNLETRVFCGPLLMRMD